MIENINWYPGHMKKTRELIQQNLKAVDVVVEIIDSRIPIASRNPIIDDLVKNKKRIVVLGKSDLADPIETRKWVEHYEGEGHRAIAMDSRTGDHIKSFYRILNEMQEDFNADRMNKRPLRIMIVGVPNVGKSSFINKLIGRKSAKTGDKPGVTRGKQWVTLENGMQLLDTPGILWPKFEDPNYGLHLAFCGSIRDEILNTQDLAYELLKILDERYPENVMDRYKLGEIDEDTLVNYEAIAMKRGCLMAGKRVDYERTGRIIIDEFREGKIGRITLENAR